MVSDENNGEQVPIIDLSLLRDTLDHHEADSLHTKVRKACEDWGCFLVVNHGIKEEIIHQMDSAARDTFKVLTETKEKNKIARCDLDYVSSVPAFPSLETLTIPGAPNPLAIRKFSDQLWPQGNHKICQIIETYAHSLEELTINIMKVILRSFGVSKYYCTCDFGGVLRMNYCNLPPQEKGGLATHTDDNCLTIVYQDNVGGLEVLSKAGKWVDVKPVANSFVVFMGDSIKAWSNGRIHNVTHRVICESSRVSLPYLYSFTDQTVIDAPHELVDDEHPRLYNPFVFIDYREYCKAKKRLLYQHQTYFLRETQEAFIDNFAGI